VGRPPGADRPKSGDPSFRDIARFAASPTGAAFARLCTFWGFDPGTLVEDDLIAMNLRAALAMALLDEPEPDDEETEADVARKHIEGMAQAHRYGDMLRKAYAHGD